MFVSPFTESRLTKRIRTNDTRTHTHTQSRKYEALIPLYISIPALCIDVLDIGTSVQWKCEIASEIT